MHVMEKNDYLSGLEVLYKKYGITKVYCNVRPMNCVQDGVFLVDVDLPVGAAHDIIDYASTENDEVYSCYTSSATLEKPPGYCLYYADGIFYTI